MTLLHARVVLGAAVVLLAASSAKAEPAGELAAAAGVLTVDGLPGKRVIVIEPASTARRAGPAARISRVLYLDRCTGTGCRVIKGEVNDAVGGISTVPKPRTGTFTLDEFVNSSGQTGSLANSEWTQILQCMKEVYSPFNITVTDQLPNGGPYHRAIIAGDPTDIAFPNDVLGVAPLANDCSAIDNTMSFTFANAHPPISTTRPATQAEIRKRVLDICWTSAQESAHAFGLDHQYEYFPSKRTACNDPMTYRNDCGGQKFFRNEQATCGETTPRACQCGAQQNSHQKILASFGPATPSTGNPTIAMMEPAASGGQMGATVSARAGSRRGVSRVAVLFNNFKWLELPGAGFGANGQPNPADYVGTVPRELPNSIVDIKLIAYDDLGASAETPTVTVTRGTPCTSADGCLKGQKCETGRCFWDPAIGELGDACEYPQFCKTNVCKGPAGATSADLICTQDCARGVDNSCPSGMVCTGTSTTDTTGICLFETDSGGCCSARRGDAGWVHLGAGALVLGLLTLRRRRR